MFLINWTDGASGETFVSGAGSNPETIKSSTRCQWLT